MKKSVILVTAMVLVGCDQQEDLPNGGHTAESADTFTAVRKQWLLADSKRREVAKQRDATIASLRSDLSAPWSSLVVALRYDCSCTGTAFTGFKIAREKDGFLVSPWSQGTRWSSTDGPERVGEARELPEAAAQQLLAETALYYLAATLSVNPLEKVDPPPTDRSKYDAWQAEYLAAGGAPEADDRIWIEIRVAMQDGVKKHSNMFDGHDSVDFGRWIVAFGEVKKSP